MKQLNRILSNMRRCIPTFPEEVRPHLTEAASPADVGAFSAALGFPVPADFSAFLGTHDSLIAMDIRKGIWVGGVPELTRSLQRGDYPRRIVPAGVEVRVVPIATNGAGDVFLLSAEGETLWHHDPVTRELRLIAPGFLPFLELVLQDFLHDQVMDHHWQYLT